MPDTEDGRHLDGERRSDLTQAQAELARFWVRVEKQDDGCWIWMGAKMPTGHGNVWIKGVPWIAHRLAYTAVRGPIPDGYVVHHRCQVPSCVNPDHLEAITRKQHAAEHGLSGAAAVHAAKTVCSEGHPFVRLSATHRGCRECKRRRQRQWYLARTGKEAGHG